MMKSGNENAWKKRLLSIHSAEMLRFPLAFCSTLSMVVLSTHYVHTEPPPISKKRRHVCASERKFVSNCGDLKIFSGSAHPQLAQEVAMNLGTVLSPSTIARFNDGEVNVKIDTSVRGIDVYVVQPTSPPVSDNLIELLLMISAMRNASCRHVTAVVPYFGYMRSDGSDLPTRAATKKSTLDDDEIGLDFLGGGQTNHRTSYLAMADVARMFEIVGCTRVVTFDLHSSGQSAAEGFFSTTRVENIRSGPTVAKALVEHLNLKDCKDLVVVAPHSSCFSKAKKFQNYLRGALGEDGPTAMGLALVVRRPPAEESGGYTVVDLVGDVKGKDVLIVEDVADTGKTLTRAARAARDAGARHVYAFVSHAVLSGEAPSRIQRCEPLEKLVALNTVPVSQESRTACPKLEFIDVAPLIANLLKDIHMSEDHAGKIEEGARVGSS